MSRRSLPTHWRVPRSRRPSRHPRRWRRTTSSPRSRSCRASKIPSITCWNPASRRPRKDLGLEIVVSPYPAHLGLHRPRRPYLDALVARGDLDYIITAPVSSTRRWSRRSRPPTRPASPSWASTPSSATANYVNGPVTFPLTYIGTDNVPGRLHRGQGHGRGARWQGQGLHPEHQPGRELGRRRAARASAQAIAEYPGMEVVDEQFSLDNEATGDPADGRGAREVPGSRGHLRRQRLQRRRRRHGGQECQPGRARSRWRPTTRPRTPSTSCVTARCPWCSPRSPTTWATWRPQFAAADHSGVTSIPKHVTTGFDILTLDNVDDPEHARFIYQ